MLWKFHKIALRREQAQEQSFSVTTACECHNYLNNAHRPIEYYF